MATILADKALRPSDSFIAATVLACPARISKALGICRARVRPVSLRAGSNRLLHQR